MDTKGAKIRINVWGTNFYKIYFFAKIYVLGIFLDSSMIPVTKWPGYGFYGYFYC